VFARYDILIVSPIVGTTGGIEMKLVYGSGSPQTGACWMSALNYYTNERALVDWHDHPKCVCETIQPLAIRLNDMCADDAERERLIGPHLFAPVGTAGVSAEIRAARVQKIVLATVRIFVPAAMDMAGLETEASELRSIPDVATYAEMRAAANAAANAAAHADADAAYAAANSAADAANSAADAASAAAYAADAANSAADAASAAAYAADAANAAANAAAHAADAADAANAAANAADAANAAYATKTNVKKELLSLILELCEMGRVESPTCRTKEHVLEALECGKF
jgi:hypothetical protein